MLADSISQLIQVCLFLVRSEAPCFVGQFLREYRMLFWGVGNWGSLEASFRLIVWTIFSCEKEGWKHRSG